MRGKFYSSWTDINEGIYQTSLVELPIRYDRVVVFGFTATAGKYFNILKYNPKFKLCDKKTPNVFVNNINKKKSMVSWCSVPLFKLSSYGYFSMLYT